MTEILCIYFNTIEWPKIYANDAIIEDQYTHNDVPTTEIALKICIAIAI